MSCQAAIRSSLDFFAQLQQVFAFLSSDQFMSFFGGIQQLMASMQPPQQGWRRTDAGRRAAGRMSHGAFGGALTLTVIAPG
jgi:hypothetical protein